jgi:hypothetical protein
MPDARIVPVLPARIVQPPQAFRAGDWRQAMKVRSKFTPLLLAFAAGLPAAAQAGVCYHVVDRDDRIVYRATDPPFALSGAEFTTGQRRLAAAGQHLFWFDTTICPEEDEWRSPGPKPVARPADAIGMPATEGASAPRRAPTPARPGPASGRGRNP